MNRKTTPLNRTTTALVALLVAAAFVGAVPFAATAQAGANGTPAGDSDDATDVRPGARLSGVVGVQSAEFEGELDERAYGVSIATAASDDARAGVVAEQLDDVEQRIDDLERRARVLEEARENGSISDGEYNASMAKIAAEKKTAERLADRSEVTASELPEDRLEANGINVTAIQTLKDEASELGGPEVAEIARSIAGPDVGERMSDGRPDHAAGGNDTDRGDRPDSVGPEGTDANRTDSGADDDES